MTAATNPPASTPHAGWRFWQRSKGESFYRYRAVVRLAHWINALAILFLLGSGLNIFNAHPRLYWGLYGADADTPFISIQAFDTPGGPRGFTQIWHWRFDTTG